MVPANGGDLTVQKFGQALSHNVRSQSKEPAHMVVQG